MDKLEGNEQTMGFWDETVENVMYRMYMYTQYLLAKMTRLLASHTFD